MNLRGIRGNFASFVIAGAALALLSACGPEHKTPRTASAADIVAPPAEAAVLCDRACLQGFTDRFLDALVAHDPDAVELAADARYTENGQDVAIGDGLWGTASANSTYRLYLADPAQGAAAFYGVIKENGDPDILALRLKVEDMQIHEAEAIVVRKGGTLFDPQNLVTPRKAFLEPVPPDERASRAGLMRIGGLYFDALQSNDGSKVPFTATCNRLENGRQMTNNPNLPPVPTPGYNIRAMNCHDNVNSRVWSYITKIDQRRWVVADTERGDALGFVMFNHDGASHPVDIPGVGKVDRGIGRPFSLLVAELFKITGGRIDQIEAVGAVLPYGASTGWDQ